MSAAISRVGIGGIDDDAQCNECADASPDFVFFARIQRHHLKQSCDPCPIPISQPATAETDGSPTIRFIDRGT